VKSIMNVLLADLEEIHLSHNEQGLIPRVSLDIADESKIEKVARELLGEPEVAAHLLERSNEVA
jgi:hypothetical protein